MEIKSYISSCQVLTNKVSSYFCSKIDKTSHIFWWGKSDEKQKLYLKSWDYLSTKRSGKFGAEKNKRFQQSFDLQAGLEGSNKWRQTMCENSECKLLKWGSSFIWAKSLKQSAWLWKVILLGRDFLHKGFVSGGIGVIVVMFWRTRRSPPSQTISPCPRSSPPIVGIELKWLILQ